MEETGQQARLIKDKIHNQGVLRLATLHPDADFTKGIVRPSKLRY